MSKSSSSSSSSSSSILRVSCIASPYSQLSLIRQRRPTLRRQQLLRWNASIVVMGLLFVVVQQVMVVAPKTTLSSTYMAATVMVVPLITSSSPSSSFFFCSASSGATSSSSSSATTTLNHLRSLDEYGNAQQLLYAMNAANKNGRQIVILTNMPSSLNTTTMNTTTTSLNSSSVWILSPIPSQQLQQQASRKFAASSPFHCRRNRRRDDDTTKSTNEVKLPKLPLATKHKTLTTAATKHPSVVSSLLYPISLAMGTYMIATGIGGDIHYLIQQLRVYYKFNYERYNNNIVGITAAPPKVTSILQFVLRQFWDYPNTKNDDNDNDDDSDIGGGGTWLPMGYQQMLQEQQQSQSSLVWGRPFGICGIVLQWHTMQQQYDITDEFDPTGIVIRPTNVPHHDDEYNDPSSRRRRIVCLGPQHKLIQEELMKIEALRQRYNITNTSSSHGNCNHIHNDSVVMTLEQQIMTAIERVLFNYTKGRNDDLPQYYQLEIINPPLLASSSSSSSSSSKVVHSIQILPRPSI